MGGEMNEPVLVTWEHKEHHFAKWNENVYCPACGHNGQWELSHRHRGADTEDLWQPYYRYCAGCLALYEMPKSITRRGDPLKATSVGDSLDKLLHECKTRELAAIEELLLDGGVQRETGGDK